MQNMPLKPQDFLVALKLVALGEQHWTYARLAHELGLSASEAHAAVKRGLASGLLADASVARAYAAARAPARPLVAREASASGLYGSGIKPAAEARSHLDSGAVVNRHNLAEFALHGAKYAFPPERLPVGPGVPTSHSAPAFAGVFAPGHEALVWPHPQGAVRGEGLAPLHPCVPAAALSDPALYELLALFDALRAGRARERGMAQTRLQKLIDPEAAPLRAAGKRRG
ncbi:MAG: hypothetical protein KF892_24560 [Rhizobacter sp.]|nr:hypothetical protein [Rhizobacter sp.]